MCIVAGQTEDIADTRIVVAKLGQNRQLTVYSNKIYAGNPVAMILPFANSAVMPEVVATTRSDNQVYSQLSSCFGDPYKKYGLNSLAASSNNYTRLQVFRSGSYRYSVAKNIEDVARVDNGVFHIKSELVELLQSYLQSPSHFGFIVCIIDKNCDYAPFAYVTAMHNNELFVPTKHYHEHVRFPRYFEPDVPAGYSEDWDHQIYVLGASEKAAELYVGTAGAYKPQSFLGGYSFSKYLDTKGYDAKNMFKITRKGVNSNIDIVLPASA